MMVGDLAVQVSQFPLQNLELLIVATLGIQEQADLDANVIASI